MHTLQTNIDSDSFIFILYINTIEPNDFPPSPPLTKETGVLPEILSEDQSSSGLHLPGPHRHLSGPPSTQHSGVPHKDEQRQQRESVPPEVIGMIIIISAVSASWVPKKVGLGGWGG